MKTLFKHTIIFPIICFLILFTFRAGNAEEDASQAEVLMMGVFHFSNPGLDVVKTDDFDVLTEESQAYLEGLSARIVEKFQPTMILLEYNPENEDVMQERYQQYLAGDYTLPDNEVYQVGFRVGKMAGGVPIASFDEQEVHWNARPLFDVMDSAPEIAAEMDQWIADYTARSNENRQTMNLEGLLMESNDPELDSANMYTYLITNAIAVDGKHQGVDATASWWERNFRMYAKIQRQAAPGARILVVGGQGHTAILKSLLDIDQKIKGVDIRPFLQN